MVSVDVFQAYDVRGVYPQQLNEDLAYKIGKAFVTILKAKTVLVGRDARLSSPSLFKALTEGIRDQGATVINIGLCSTPLFYFAARQAPAAIMITASHLPKQYNGFKFCREKAFPISASNGLQQLKKLVERDAGDKVSIMPGKKIRGKMIQRKVLPQFIQYNLAFLKLLNLGRGKKTYKMVLDAGNGMGGHTLPKILRKIRQVQLITQHTKVDFTFPHHAANPLLTSTLKDLQGRVKKERADFGLATDGDNDRGVFVDENGKVISSDLTLALLAKEILSKKPGSTILYDVRCSRIVHETIKESGGNPIMSRVGHSFIKQQMRREKAILAGELSGHLYYSFNNYAENPFMALALLVSLLDTSGQKLSALVNPLRKYFHTGEINCTVKDKQKVMAKINGMYKGKAKKILHRDGLSIYLSKWWFNLRESHTEDVLRLNLEANSRELMLLKKREILSLLK